MYGSWLIAENFKPMAMGFNFLKKKRKKGMLWIINNYQTPIEFVFLLNVLYLLFYHEHEKSKICVMLWLPSLETYEPQLDLYKSKNILSN